MNHFSRFEGIRQLRALEKGSLFWIQANDEPASKLLLESDKP